MNPVDTVPLMLLALHMLALGVIGIIFLGMLVLHRRARAKQEVMQSHHRVASSTRQLRRDPQIWLAVQTSNPEAVQAALRSGRTAPCSLGEGPRGENKFTIGSPVNDWIIVTGPGLPRPDLDVDRCFHFLSHLSRILGHVQFFMTNPVSCHHAWVRVESGVIKRAYAWTGETVWNQGTRSLAEIELNMKCYGYAESVVAGNVRPVPEPIALNARNVPLLAARWSINPAAVDGDTLRSAGGIVRGSTLFRPD